MFALGMITATWVVFAVFCGFGLGISLDRSRSVTQRLVPCCAVVVVLGPTTLFLFFQNFTFYLGPLELPFDLMALGLLFATVLAYAGAADRSDRLFRALSLLTLGLAFLCFVSFQFFLPLLFFPASEVVVARTIFAAVFSVIVAAAFILSRRAMAKREEAAASPYRPSSRGRPAIVMAGAMIFLAGIYFSPAVQTQLILHKRNHSMQVFHAALAVALAARSESEGAGNSVYPADLGLKTVATYLEYLQKQHLIEEPLGVGPGELRIANLSSRDPDDTIFIRSTQDQLDIHTIIHNLGGIPNYAHGFILVDKNGHGQFYWSEMAGRPELGLDPPRSPAYLAPN